MKPQVKKWLIVGGLGAVSVLLAVAYLQYKKIMNYVVKVTSIRVKSITAQLFDFDLFVNLTNKADVSYSILSQEYKVYVNDKFLSQLVNLATIDVPKKGSVDMPINVKIKPDDVLNLLKTSYAELILTPEKVSVKIDIKLKVSFYGIKLSIPTTYQTNLKALISGAKTK